MAHLKIGHVNLGSLVSHFDAFADFLRASDFDALAVTETWLRADIGDHLVSVEGYSFVRVDRGSRGGGVGVYLRDTLPYSRIDAPEADTFEHVWTKFRVGRKLFAFGVLYRPPHPADYPAAFTDSLQEVLASIFPTVDELIVVGDFNVNLLNVNKPKVQQLISLFDSFGLRQVVGEPTRVTASSATLIDLMVISCPDVVGGVGVEDLGNITDHFLTYCSITLPGPGSPPEVFESRCYGSIDGVRFRGDLMNMNWAHIFDLPDVDQKVSYFNTLVLALFDFYAPLVRRVRKRGRLPWITYTIKEMIKLRDRANRRFRRTRNEAHWQYYKQLRNLTTEAIRREKKAYVQSALRGAAPRDLWRRLRGFGLTSSRGSVIPDSLCDPELLNTYFLESIRQLRTPADRDLMHFYRYNRKSVGAPTFSFSDVVDSDVVRALDGIKSTAVGVDGIDVRMLRLCSSVVVPHMTHIFNCCLRNSVFPTLWKSGVVRPIPKSSRCASLGDVRPITLLPVMSKIFERLIASQITPYMESCAILPVRQSGFREGHSCCTALLDIVDDALAALDSGKNSILILLDFSRAFDILDHGLLLEILSYVGFDESCVGFFGSYLGTRRQRVVVRRRESSFRDVTCGVPQGSVLGPLLFAIYTCDLFTRLTVLKYHLYADDSQLYCSFASGDVSEVIDSVNDDLDSLAASVRNHALRLNPDKSKAILLSGRGGLCRDDPRLNVLLMDKRVEFFQTVRTLGVYLDEDLRFEEHIKKMTCRAFASLRLLYSGRDLLSGSMRRMLCSAMVLSHFNYCDVLYGPCLTVRCRRRVQVVQNACLRYVHGLGRREHVSHWLGRTGWLNMQQTRTLHSLSMFHKIVCSHKPSYLYSRITFRTDVHNINVRRRMDVSVPRHVSAAYERSFTYMVSSLWNMVPIHVRESRSLSALRRWYLLSIAT